MTQRPAGLELLTPRSERLIAVVLITFHILMSIGYSLGPIFEGPDEIYHYAYIRYLLNQRALPDYQTAARRFEVAEYHQAPLYYLIGALIRSSLPDSDYDTFRQNANPYSELSFDREGWSTFPQPGNYNKNYILHNSNEAFPFTGSETGLVVHILRLYSVVLSALTVITGAAIYRLLWSDRPAYRLLALGITCAWPSFQYISGLVNNDNLAILLVTVCVFLCLRMLKTGPSWRSATVMGLALGAAMLAKQNAPLLIAPIATVFLVSGKKTWRYGLATLGITLAISGWWLARNTILYGDPTGLLAPRLFSPVFIPDGGYAPFGTMAARWLQAYQMVWARYGFTYNVPVPASMGGVYDLITAAGAWGIIVIVSNALRTESTASTKRLRLQQLAVMAAFTLAWIGGFSAHIFTSVFGALGRLLLPGVAVWAAALSLGLHWWIPERYHLRLTGIMGAVMGALAIAALTIFHAAYQPLLLPPRVEAPRHFVYDQTVELIGVDQEAIEAYPEKTVEFTLYWKALKPTTHNLLVNIHTFGGRAIEIETYPGSGHLLSTDWAAGQTWAEHYRVKLGQGASPGEPLTLVVFLMNTDSYPPQLLPITGPGNKPIMFPAVISLVIQRAP